jgi:hypothetical protein
MMKKIILLMFVSISLNAADLTIPNTFIANTPAVASEVNGNFGAVETAVDDNNSRIAALEATIASLQTTVNSLNSRLTMVENNTVLELDGLLQFSMFKGYPTAEFTGVNIQVNNGVGSTFSRNGLGNIIIGYNEASNSATEFCSNPLYTDSVNCIGNLAQWGRNVYRGSHNLILGSSNSYDDYAGIVAGRYNVINNTLASVLGGESNISSGFKSMILGGVDNISSGIDSTVSAGTKNQAIGRFSSVVGGAFNQSIGQSSTSGGNNNRALGLRSSVSGGSNRTAFGDYDWVAGSLFEDN